MRKLIFLITIVLISITTCYGYEYINIHPEYIFDNTSKILFEYTFEPNYPVNNFNLTLKSNGILFEKNAIYMPYIEENNKFYINISGQIINNSMDKYTIVVSVKYVVYNSPINYIKIYTLYRINNTEIAFSNQQQKDEILSNTTNESTTMNTLEDNTEENIEDNISGNISSTEESIRNTAEKETNPTINIYEKNITNNEGVNNNKTVITNNTSEKIQDEISINYSLYAILGLISGIITASIIIYLYNM